MSHNRSERSQHSPTLFKRLRARYSHKPWRFFIGIICAVLCVIALLLPSPYVVQMPGPTQNVLGKSGDTEVISVEGATTYRSEQGELLLTTVNATGVPGYEVPTAVALYGWINPDMTDLPTEAVFPAGQTAQEYKESTQTQMSSSQDAATSAGLAFAKQLGVDTSNVKVTMHVDDIGGPSAGMMYTLGLIDLLTPQNETGGKIIAGTGTMSDDGTVGAIGGIQLKMKAAQRDGATWFLAPKANCSSVVGNVPNGLRDVAVSNLTEAYNALVAIGEGKADDLPHCTVES